MKTIKSPAKINLFLYVTGKRGDGYHNLFTLMSRIDIADIISVEEAEKTTLSVSGEFSSIPFDGRNMILQADRLFRGRFPDRIPPLKITLEKNIPVGSGLGGGSSNAAYYLKLLWLEYANDIGKNELKDILLNIGSDTAFFLDSFAHIAAGRGDILKVVLDFPLVEHILLVYPHFSLSTKEVYSNPCLKFTKKNLPKMKNLVQGFKDIENHMFANDLEAPAFALRGELRELKDALEENGARALMTGSGSAVFGIYEDGLKLDSAHKNLMSRYPNYRFWKTKTISQ